MAYRKTLVVNVCVALGGGVVSAQTAPTQAQQPQREAKRQNLPPAVSTNGMAEQTAAMIQRTGGSLLQAQLATPANPVQAQAGSVSFMAVPEPTPRMLRAHDLVTIIVNEQSEITTKGTSNITRDSQLDAKVNNFVKFKPGNLTLQGLQATTTPEVNVAGNRTFQGQGDVERTDSFTARITAEVVDVKPNGTVVLQARKRIKADEEEQTFILTGTCRAEDITAADSVLSNQLYDLQLQKIHTGDVRNATKRGLIGKLLDFVNPF
jgi:flagellar L-ring protein precursor FlgH